jgi:UDP-N-acetylglucosamine acyltransferase
VIDKRADIHPSARIAEGVTIGPWTVIGADVEIGEGSHIGSHVVIKGPTRIGKDNKIYQFASVGEDPQDKKWQGEKTYLEVGDRNVIREFCTLNRGTVQGGGATRVGNDNLLMAYVHLAHDCIIGNGTIFANNASLAGHVTVHDYVTLGGFSGVHQNCVLGAYSFVAKAAIVAKDVLPYVLVTGNMAEVCGLNTEGLKRRGFSAEVITALRRAYKVIYRSGLTVSQALTSLEDMVLETPEIQLLIDALKLSTRGIVR